MSRTMVVLLSLLMVGAAAQVEAQGRGTRQNRQVMSRQEIARDPLALGVAVGEGRRRDDLAIDEGVGWRHYAILRNRYAG